MCLAEAVAVAALLAADPAFDAIVTSATSTSHEQALARMQEWVDAHPGDPESARALVWMARLRRSDGRDEAARALLERALREGPGTEWALHAEKALGDLDLEAHRYAPAIARYDHLAGLPAPLWRYVGSSAAGHARGERTRFRILIAILAALAALSLARVIRAGGPRSLWPPPAELLWLLPVLLVLLAAAAAQEAPEARAVVSLSLGGAALLWLNGAWLRARPPRRMALPALLGLGQALALLYCAMVWNGLWDKLVDTIAMGAQ